MKRSAAEVFLLHNGSVWPRGRPHGADGNFPGAEELPRLFVKRTGRQNSIQIASGDIASQAVIHIQRVALAFLNVPANEGNFLAGMVDELCPQTLLKYSSIWIVGDAELHHPDPPSDVTVEIIFQQENPFLGRISRMPSSANSLNARSIVTAPTPSRLRRQAWDGSLSPRFNLALLMKLTNSRRTASVRFSWLFFMCNLLLVYKYYT
ncbi:MAG: hypothetical protein L6W00_15970 [Lentisphaeria bacterium]|nr:MAG: hypothetical protein L6W00_15970 [Lentisphaeria bacterium]